MAAEPYKIYIYDPITNAKIFDFEGKVGDGKTVGDLVASAGYEVSQTKRGPILDHSLSLELDVTDLIYKYVEPSTITSFYLDGTKYKIGGAEYNAGEGILIGTVHSDMQGPAPDGFHVPLKSEWQAVYNIWTALGGGSSDGTNFGIALKLPFAGIRASVSAGIYYQGTNGNYWSSSRSNANFAYYLYFGSSALNPQSSSDRAYGSSVRCFKNSPTIPTSSWTKLYGTSIEAGGIFWSSTDGLISLSSDGNTWITIADKNLGATTVWNSGDTLSEANCGYYYQRGNNYGFPRTGTIANQSTTQVDASNYGPGNYYSSDTFIKYSGRWDSTDNGNLWGGVTQGTWVGGNTITNTGVLSVNGQTGDVTIASPDMSNYLAKDNTTAFTPTGDYQPATKKYVDDNAPNVIAMTQAEYNALPATTKNDGKLRIISDAPAIDIGNVSSTDVTTIVVSTSAPASGTASNIITIVTD